MTAALSTIHCVRAPGIETSSEGPLVRCRDVRTGEAWTWRLGYASAPASERDVAEWADHLGSVLARHRSRGMAIDAAAVAREAAPEHRLLGFVRPVSP